LTGIALTIIGIIAMIGAYFLFYIKYAQDRQT